MDDGLSLTRAYCANCGYSLWGLSARGRCPECGESYDDRVMILFGWGADRFRKSPAFTAFYIVALVMAIFFWIDATFIMIGALVMLFRADWRRCGLVFLVGAGYGVAGLVMFIL